LNSEKVMQLMTNKRVVYLEGDWTRQDPSITRELERHGRSGVPLYLLYPAGSGAPLVLPQLLTQGSVINAISKL
jgi:thiol:disulfide interchange protein